MDFLRATKASSGACLGTRIFVADTFWSRFCGLMLRPQLLPGEGLLLEPCSSIHMLFMRFPIDAAFLGADNRVVAVYHALRPWIGFSWWHRRAVKVLELPAGTLCDNGVGTDDILTLEVQ